MGKNHQRDFGHEALLGHFQGFDQQTFTWVQYIKLECFLCVHEMPLFEIMPILVVFIELDLLSWLFFHEADILVQVTLYDIKISGTFCIFSTRQILSDRYVM